MSAGRDLLKRLKFRESLGDSYMVRTARRDRVALVVPTMMADRHLERSASYQTSTVDELLEQGLITLADAAVDVTFGYALKGDAKLGRRIRITDAGKATISPATTAAPGGAADA